ncbi:c-type cytochrome [Lentisphaera profundi]|uniref:C-type cytochrome n=1 Tax=Lentisphaera profundi TaxID=1658616 RepID=A0ABY7VW87_9BACT|nr:c-type cytochrome [Lentisphaera profundi]WDE98493.1 c-type cytochrome [Lentisphaera profundi]
MKRTFLLLFLLMQFWSSCQQHEPSSKVDQEVLNNCMICHDNKEMQRGPILDGLQAEYMLQQVKKFRIGQRGTHKFDYQGALMASAIQSLEEDKIASAISEISQRKPRPYIRTVKGDVHRGEILYKETCHSCHGENAEGIKDLKTANLAILEDWYLLMQLRNFKSSRRGYHADDIQGQIMRTIVAPLNDKDFKSLVKYISQINLKK